MQCILCEKPSTTRNYAYALGGKSNEIMKLTSTMLGNPDDGLDSYATVKSVGTDEIVRSNTIKYHQ